MVKNNATIYFRSGRQQHCIMVFGYWSIIYYNNNNNNNNHDNVYGAVIMT